jgi:hypothetical protein
VTQTLSLGETRLNVVLTQFKLSALAKTGIAAKKTKATKDSFTCDFFLAPRAVGFNSRLKC